MVEGVSEAYVIVGFQVLSLQKTVNIQYVHNVFLTTFVNDYLQKITYFVNSGIQIQIYFVYLHLQK